MAGGSRVIQGQRRVTASGGETAFQGGRPIADVPNAADNIAPGAPLGDDEIMQLGRIARLTTLKPGTGQVLLYHPRYESLVFGPHGKDSPDNITFGAAEPHVAIVAADHPLLKDLMRLEPGVQIIEHGDGTVKVYACPDDTFEARTVQEYRHHRATAHQVVADSPEDPKPASDEELDAGIRAKIAEASDEQLDDWYLDYGQAPSFGQFPEGVTWETATRDQKVQAVGDFAVKVPR